MNDSFSSHLENLQKAFSKLESFSEISRPSEVIRGGIIQAFEYTFELFWKTFQDLGVANGLVVNSPKSAIKAAFMLEYIKKEQIWLSMLKDRSLTVHTYNEKLARAILRRIKNNYIREMSSVLKKL